MKDDFIVKGRDGTTTQTFMVFQAGCFAVTKSIDHTYGWNVTHKPTTLSALYLKNKDQAIELCKLLESFDLPESDMKGLGNDKRVLEIYAIVRKFREEKNI